MARLQAREEERSIVVEYSSFVELESKRKSSSWNEASLREQGREILGNAEKPSWN